MIERKTIDGRPATVAYIGMNFEPASRAAYAYARILFDDGDSLFLVGPKPQLITGRSYAAHAARIARDDHNRIDKAIRVGLIGGLDSAEIARKVIGNANVNGNDGETEVTRQRVARLGLAAIRPRKKSHAKRR